MLMAVVGWAGGKALCGWTDRSHSSEPSSCLLFPGPGLTGTRSAAACPCCSCAGSCPSCISVTLTVPGWRAWGALCLSRWGSGEGTAEPHEALEAEGWRQWGFGVYFLKHGANHKCRREGRTCSLCWELQACAETEQRQFRGREEACVPRVSQNTPLWMGNLTGIPNPPVPPERLLWGRLLALCTARGQTHVHCPTLPLVHLRPWFGCRAGETVRGGVLYSKCVPSGETVRSGR